MIPTLDFGVEVRTIARGSSLRQITDRYMVGDQVLVANALMRAVSMN